MTKLEKEIKMIEELWNDKDFEKHVKETEEYSKQYFKKNKKIKKSLDK